MVKQHFPAPPQEQGISLYNRDKTIDVVKGFGIILMVIGHTGSIAHDFIYMFHMALFFMLSGYLWSDKKAADFPAAKKFVLSRLKGLLIPYAVCNGTFTLLNNLLVKLHINPESSRLLTPMETAVNLAKNMLFAGDTTMGGATWFFRTLFFVSMAHLAVRYICLRWKLGKAFFIAVIIAAFAGAVVIDYADINLPMGISSCFSAYCTFLMGMFLKQFRIMEKAKKWDVPIAVAAFVLLLILTPYGPIGIGAGSIVNLPLFCIASLAGWFMAYCLARKLKGWLASVISYCGMRSVWIVTLHFLAFKIVAAGYLLITNSDITMLSHFPVYYVTALIPVYTVVGIGFPLLVCYIWRSIKRCFEKRIKTR
ncbi:MAG: acyltransferase family protein [Oscillospiraceae bacterium]|nr:acyltransferase family protein [Oscillospiraceae bacterium]